MSKTATLILSVLAAAALLAAGVWTGLRFGYSQFAAASLGIAPALLALFPVVRERSGGAMTFAQWAGTVLFIAFFAAAFHNIIARFL